VKEHEEDIPTSQQEQKKNTWFSCENENCRGQRRNTKTTRKGEKKPHRISLIDILSIVQGVSGGL
jgi:hypothetical protein